jgi:hypothetical protein
MEMLHPVDENNFNGIAELIDGINCAIVIYKILLTLSCTKTRNIFFGDCGQYRQ